MIEDALGVFEGAAGELVGGAEEGLVLGCLSVWRLSLNWNSDLVVDSNLGGGDARGGDAIPR